MSVPPVHGPVNAPVPTQPTVEEVLNQLTNKEVNKLWKEKVSDQSKAIRPFLWAFHNICLLTGTGKMGEAKSRDKHVENFEKAAKELAVAAATRAFTPEEAKKIGLNKVTTTPKGQSDEFRAKVRYEKAVSRFYAAFKARVTDLGGMDSNFNHYATAAKLLLNKQMADAHNEARDITSNRDISHHRSESAQKLNIAKDYFDKIIFDDLVNSFAEQDIQNITVEGYKAKRDQIGEMFKAPKQDTEVKLRNAIRENHPNLADLSAEFGSTAPDAPRLVERKAALETSLNAALKTVNDRLQELCGLQGNDGLVNAAWLELDAANRTFNEKRDAFRTLITAQGQDLNNIDVLLAIDPANPAIATAKAEFVAANTAKVVKQAAFDALKAEIDGLATWNGPNNIVAGKHADISAKLRDIHTTATAECTQLSKFYAELAKEFNPGTNSVATTHNNLLHANMQVVIG